MERTKSKSLDGLLGEDVYEIISLTDLSRIMERTKSKSLIEEWCGHRSETTGFLG